MATGFRIRNANGSVQIDDSYQNLALRSKGTVVSGGNSTGAGWYAASVTLPSTVVVAFRCASACLLMSQIVNGSTKQVSFRTQGTGITVEWFAFDTADLGLSYGGSYGLRVRTKTGAVAFDSRMKYMRIIGQIAGTSAQNAVGTYTYGAGQAPAVVQGPLCYSSQTVPLTGTGAGSDVKVQYVFFGLSASISGSAITLANSNTDGFLYEHAAKVPPGLDSQQATYSYLVLDVANF